MKTPKIEGCHVIRWGNIKTGEQFYGLKVKVGGKWLYYAEDGSAVIYKTRKAAEKHRDALMKAQGGDHA